MNNFHDIEQQLISCLHLTRRPVAIAFRDTPPAGVAKFDGVQPSGCSFWKLAADGRVFYTVAADHYNCPVGSYTHNIPLPPEREHELPDTLGLMTQVGYIRMEEVPGIPRLATSPGAIVYAPLGDTPIDPDAVIVTGRAATLMLLQEAAQRGGAALQPLLGRPTCMAIPVALGGAVVSSLGCIGNRVYTDLPDDELYTAMSGQQVGVIAGQLATIISANQALTDHHQRRIVEFRR